MTKRIVTACSIFLGMFFGGWLLNEREVSISSPPVQHEDAVEPSVSIQSIQAVENLNAVRFRPREYVKIVSP